MAAVQSPREMKMPATMADKEESIDLMALTMAALRLVNPWVQKPQPWAARPAPGAPGAKDRLITLAEVSQHDTYRDCWVVIYDRVYDITNFFDEHPGGADIMLECAGQDASTAFRSSGHSAVALKALESYLVGSLPQHECMYRRPDGIRLSNIPE